MTSTKPFGGYISNWFKEDWSEFKDTYGPSLGFVVHGDLGRDFRDRGFDYRPIRTSMVVKEYVNPDTGDHTIETLNTVYILMENE